MKYVAVEGSFKAGVIVAKALARKATERNNVRRAAYRALASTPLPDKGFQVVFFVRSIPPKAKTEAFREEVAVLLKKL
jgi:ribonuclease P protein component